MKPVTTDEMRELDRWAIQELGIPSLVLMEVAGRAVVQEAMKMLGDSRGPVVVLCGKGNNGGDGLVVARHLLNAGVDLSVLILGTKDQLSPDARANLDILERLGFQPEPLITDQSLAELPDRLAPAELIIDALLGTGLKGSVSEKYRHIIDAINGSGSPILAVDIPSGLDGDTGQPLGSAVKATRTVTFQCPKKGFSLAPGPEYVGELIVADIGIPTRFRLPKSNS